MPSTTSPDQIVRDIINANLYMVLATADRSGRPWSTPVYFADRDCQEFYWVSSPRSAHSRNLDVRPQVGIAIFDSSAPIGTGQGVYMSTVAEPVSDRDIERGIEIFSRRSLSHGGHAWTIADVQDTTGLRLYHAVAEDHWILAKDGQPDHRIPVQLTAGQAPD
ncbi:MAG TPA: pyridoxamine 5'-phosphate oxidase family protein [Mycobacterium sp.]|nr:pyridoxamine 5'-phosphate oxidase family protein [Mycobacterium sp.]